MFLEKMKIIAIEGLDKSGKASVTKGLAERLRTQGFKVAVSEFHRYDTPTGQLIQQWLYKKYTVSQQVIELIMAADKYAQIEYFEQLEQEGYDFLILDRYIGSQYVYSAAAGIDKEWVKQIMIYLPKPNFEIFIDVSPETSMKRKGKHGENDRYESDKALLTRVRSGFILSPSDYRRTGDGTIFKTISGEGTIEESIQSAYESIKEYL